MLIYFVSGKILLEAAQLQNRCILFVFMYLLYLYTTCVVCKLMTCITCVLRVFTGSHAHAKIACKSECACHFLVLHAVRKCAGTHVYQHTHA